MSGQDYEFCAPTKTERPNDYWCDGRPWKPRDFAELLKRTEQSNQYSEFVVDGLYWNLHLPHSVEAFIVGEGGKVAAHALHQRFLDAYHLTAQDVPLVSFHPRGEVPFTLE